MRQGAKTRIVIGSAVRPKRVHRTLESAFGDGARLSVESTSDRLDRFIGRLCFVFVCAAMAVLIVNAAYGGL